VGVTTAKTKLGNLHVGFLVVKLLPGFGGLERIPDGLSRDAAIEWAKETLKMRFHNHTAWLNLSAADRVFLRGVN
jgi:hypothetical protein